MADVFKVINSLYAESFKGIENNEGKTKNNTILMGSYVKVLPETDGKWQHIEAFGKKGWIDKDSMGGIPGLKCFYLDCGQGDSSLIEIGGDDAEGLKIIIDGGPGDNLSRYLNKWQYKYYLNKGQKIHINYMFISHFDKDHYNGLIELINNDHYTFGTIYHNGIAKFSREKETFPASYNTELGQKVKTGQEKYLVTYFDDIDSLANLKNKGGLSDMMENFLAAVSNAYSHGRLDYLKKIDFKSTLQSHTINNVPFEISVMGPVTSEVDSEMAFKYFDDDSHTINGHSLVLKLRYGTKTFLFGGDLNIQSETHLLEHYTGQNVFEVDVAKACHHGSSEFTTDFMAVVNPLSTVISSGDNESYSHPRADAIGCAGKSLSYYPVRISSV